MDHKGKSQYDPIYQYHIDSDQNAIILEINDKGKLKWSHIPEYLKKHFNRWLLGRNHKRHYVILRASIHTIWL